MLVAIETDDDTAGMDSVCGPVSTIFAKAGQRGRCLRRHRTTSMTMMRFAHSPDRWTLGDTRRTASQWLPGALGAVVRSPWRTRSDGGDGIYALDTGSGSVEGTMAMEGTGARARGVASPCLSAWATA
jgi:hypothetical protein